MFTKTRDKYAFQHSGILRILGAFDNFDFVHNRTVAGLGLRANAKQQLVRKRKYRCFENS